MIAHLFTRLHCLISHRPEWSLYGGGRFIHCNDCQNWYGDVTAHTAENSPAIPYPSATDEAQREARHQIHEGPFRPTKNAGDGKKAKSAA